MFRVAQMQPEDYQFAVDLANTMDWNMTLEDFQFNATLEPEGCFVLREGEQPIGVATCISYGKAGWFGNLVVKETKRQQGAGTALVKHAIGYLRGKQVPTIGLYAYPNLVNFYGNFGFKPDAEFVVLKADRITAVPKKTTGLRKADQQDLASIANLDRQCFGASRLRLLKLILQNPKNACFIVEEKGRIDGFVTVKCYPGLGEVGPVVCHAGKTGIAVTLFQRILEELKGLEVWMCMPTKETVLMRKAFAAGFLEEFRVVRMFLGSAVAGKCVYVAESLERG